MRNTQMMKVPEVCAELYRKENKKKTLKTCAGVHERGLMSFPWKASEIANWQREAFVKFVFSNTRECCPSLSQTNFLSLVLALHGTFRLNSSSSVARCFGWGDVAVRGNTVNFPSLSSVNVRRFPWSWEGVASIRMTTEETETGSVNRKKSFHVAGRRGGSSRRKEMKIGNWRHQRTVPHANKQQIIYSQWRN